MAIIQLHRAVSKRVLLKTHPAVNATAFSIQGLIQYYEYDRCTIITGHKGREGTFRTVLKVAIFS